MATIGIGEDGEYADGFIRPIKEQIHVPFDDPSHDKSVPMIVGKVATYKNVLISVLLPSAAT